MAFDAILAQDEERGGEGKANFKIIVVWDLADFEPLYLWSIKLD